MHENMSPISEGGIQKSIHMFVYIDALSRMTRFTKFEEFRDMHCGARSAETKKVLEMGNEKRTPKHIRQIIQLCIRYSLVAVHLRMQSPRAW